MGKKFLSELFIYFFFLQQASKTEQFGCYQRHLDLYPLELCPQMHYSVELIISVSFSPKYPARTKQNKNAMKASEDFSQFCELTPRKTNRDGRIGVGESYFVLFCWFVCECARELPFSLPRCCHGDSLRTHTEQPVGPLDTVIWRRR